MNKEIENNIREYERKKGQIAVHEKQINDLKLKSERQIQVLEDQTIREIELINNQIDVFKQDLNEFVLDHKWDYDSFEYYDGDLTGKNRILKDISSFIKGKIGLELFIHAYDFYKTEHKNEMPNFYTDEALKLVGMSDEDIEKINHKSNKENIL